MFAPATVPESPKEIDRITLARAAGGDHTCFRSLVDCYHRRVFALLWRMLDPAGRADRVEDLTQETFVRVYRALDRFDPAGAARLSTWILTIATRLAMNELRKRVAATVPLDDVAEHLAVPAGDRRRQLGRAIARAIGELSPEQRAAVVLREYHGLDYADIAAALEVDLGTVKSRLSRARARLRAALEEVRHG